MSYEMGQNLPDKLYFRIGEVSDIVGVKPYVLRYWETEFTDIKPSKSKSGQRLYRKRDVELLLKIKELLYTERFTINGAKQRLKDVGKASTPTVHEAPKHEAPRQEELLLGSEAEELEEELVVPPAEVVKTVGADKKFLKKMKNDLEWCLTEIRSG